MPVATRDDGISPVIARERGSDFPPRRRKDEKRKDERQTVEGCSGPAALVRGEAIGLRRRSADCVGRVVVADRPSRICDAAGHRLGPVPPRASRPRLRRVFRLRDRWHPRHGPAGQESDQGRMALALGRSALRDVSPRRDLRSCSAGDTGRIIRAGRALPVRSRRHSRDSRPRSDAVPPE